MTLDFSYFGTKIPLSNVSSIKQKGMPTCSTIRVTILASTTEILLVMFYRCTVGESVWSAKAYIYIWIDLFLLTALYSHLIFPLVESEGTSG